MSARTALATLVALVSALLSPTPTWAAEGMCHVVDVQLQPQKRTDVRPGRQQPPQIVIWVEDAEGNYIDTVFITQKTGTYGLGNRPGRMDFNSAPLWPYGRRTTTFPVWADKQPLRWPLVIFQDGNDDGLSHAVNESSRDLHFCRPQRPQEFVDAVTCATEKALTDKGVLGTADASKYPPREDIVHSPTIDDPSIHDQRRTSNVQYRIPFGMNRSWLVKESSMNRPRARRSTLFIVDRRSFLIMIDDS